MKIKLFGLMLTSLLLTINIAYYSTKASSGDDELRWQKVYCDGSSTKYQNICQKNGSGEVCQCGGCITRECATALN